MRTFKAFMIESMKDGLPEMDEKTGILYELIAASGNSERVLFDLVAALPDAAFKKAVKEIEKNYPFTGKTGESVYTETGDLSGEKNKE
jgi:hypothetical protein